MMNNKNFLMFVKGIQDALPVDVPIIKMTRAQGSLNGIKSAFRFISPNSTFQLSNRRCIAFRG